MKLKSFINKEFELNWQDISMDNLNQSISLDAMKYDDEVIFNMIKQICMYMKSSKKSEYMKKFDELHYDIFDQIEDLDLTEHQLLYQTFRIGQLFAFIKIEEFMDNLKEESINPKMILNLNNHMEDIIRIVYKERRITHQELADTLGLQKNYLTNIMKRVYAYDIFDVERIGKNKWYELTKNGMKIYFLLENKSNSKKTNFGSFIKEVFDDELPTMKLLENYDLDDYDEKINIKYDIYKYAKAEYAKEKVK